MGKVKYYEGPFVKKEDLKPGDHFCEATDCLNFVFEGFDKLDDPVKLYEPPDPDFNVYKFIRLEGDDRDVYCETVKADTKAWVRFNMDCDIRFRRVFRVVEKKKYFIRSLFFIHF